jgi:hypothetical protein
MTRLTSAMQVALVMRLVQAQGGAAMLLKRGEEERGSILIASLEKGEITGVYERILTRTSAYQWDRVGPQVIEKPQEIDDFLERRKARDPDLWLIELDIPNAERFIAQLDEKG